MKGKRVIITIFIIILIIVLIIKIIPMIILKCIESANNNGIIIQNSSGGSSIHIQEKRYNIFGLIEEISESQDNNLIDEHYNIILKNDLPYTNSEIFDFNVNLTNLDNNSLYTIKINDEEYVLEEGDNIVKYNLKEGDNVLAISLNKDSSSFYDVKVQKLYIKEYKKQFLDEYSTNAVSTHFDYKIDDERTIQLLNYLGIKTIRDDISWKNIENKNGEYDFSKYDDWILKLNENNIEVIAIINNPGELLGDDKLISSQDEIDKMVKFVTTFAKRYPMITKYEILNEANFLYTTDEKIEYYIKTVSILNEQLKQINPEIEILAGGTAGVVYDEENKISSTNFIKYILQESQTINNISIHQYDEFNNTNWTQKMINEHIKMLNDLGGFYKINVSEYGASSHTKGFTEIEQANKILKQTVTYDKNNIKEKVVYNSRNIGESASNQEHNFGLITYDYTPKPAYYTMKNYYENTNGAEYIGTVNLANGLEAHVYNKDGKPKIIAWTTNSNNNINIPYEDFTASDMYGNAIENTDGTLTITASPVYLDNVSTKYFYEAISNTSLEKYSEFEEKFSQEIASIDGMQGQIDKLKNYMSSISGNTTETQENAIEMMSEHFALGTTILNAFNNEKLNVEYVKVSSMLDMLNDIGNSYEDLLTVSATSRAAYFTATEELINKAETTINNNSDLNIIYPSKILDFAKELHEKSEYINSLEEENDIKTGLIVSNSLHAYYLADWANDFANIYINKYIKENPVTVSYSNTDEFTNQDITVTLNIGSDSKVTNNNGQNTYIFTKNGTFTFEYERRGQAFKEEIKITSIDKDAPVISGVVNGKIYTNSATPVIKDENLASIEVLFNGTSIQYSNGAKLAQEGIYNIIATDKAGNKTEIEIYIVEDGTDGYTINNGYILNVRQKTKLEQFAKKFNLTKNYTVKRNDKELSKDDIVATGDILQLNNGAEYTIVVAGDINGDGKVTTYDLSTFRRYILKLREFNEIESLAADINVDGQELGVKDYTRMRIEILGEY